MATATDRLSPMAKWLIIIEAFLEQEEWGVRDLSRRTELPRSAVHRMLHEMEQLGLLTTAGQAGRFRPGPALVRTATVLFHRFDLTRVARPILEETMHQCKETVILTMYDPARRQFFAVDAAESQQAVRYIWAALSDWSDLHLGSSGKGILAFLPEAEQEAILDELPNPVPGLRPTTKAELRQQLAEARCRGYVVSRSERYDGAMGVAAPIRDALGRVVGDAIITAPVQRMGLKPDEDWGALAVQAATRISAALGYRGAD